MIFAMSITQNAIKVYFVVCSSDPIKIPTLSINSGLYVERVINEDWGDKYMLKYIGVIMFKASNPVTSFICVAMAHFDMNCVACTNPVYFTYNILTKILPKRRAIPICESSLPSRFA